jgi:GDP-D-mannose 3', 5'-epimerase
MRSSAHPRVLVTGAGGFIGHHLITALKQRGYWVRGVDTSPPEYTVGDADEFELRDLRRFDECLLATRGIDHVYALAADMGGMGFISTNHATILRNNALINIHTLEAARVNGASRYLFSSSACVYPDHLQAEANVAPLKEEDAYPASPQDAYGWESSSPSACACTTPASSGSRRELSASTTSMGHMGPTTAAARRCPRRCAGRWPRSSRAGRSRSGATGSRRGRSATSMTASRGSTGSWSRTSGSRSISASEEMITVNELARMIIDVSGKDGISLRHIGGPQGVRGRNSDNRRLREVLGWEPSVPLRQGLEPTYRWIEKQVMSRRPPWAAAGR